MLKAEKAHLNSVAELGCIVCSNMGFMGSAAEIHHIGNGTMGKRASNYEIIPLCPFIIGLVDMVTQSMQAVKLGLSVTALKGNC